MEFDKIVITITQLVDGRWNMIAVGVNDDDLDPDGIVPLGSVTSKDRSTLIDWFIEKVEEV